METNQAAENLQVIRTLMERSALYRRALAPIMVFCGSIGTIGGIAGWSLHFDSPRAFILYWIFVAALALIGSFLLVRRQALRDSEPFWSLPTKRVATAMFPAFFMGFVLEMTILCLTGNGYDSKESGLNMLVLSRVWLYGCAIHAAGFFMQRGFKLFGWLFVLVGCGLLVVWARTVATPNSLPTVSGNLLMAGIFGGFHLAYGIYLYFTEQRKNVA